MCSGGGMTEEEVELAALGWFQSLNFKLRTAADIDEAGERADLTQLPQFAAEKIFGGVGTAPVGSP